MPDYTTSAQRLLFAATHRAADANNPLALPVASIPRGNLHTLKNRAMRCQACPLWAPATQTVFGKGRANAPLMLIGEQPGDREDKQGRPFTGPAGALLQRALDAAELQHTDIYLTNVMKHFKFERHGKTRLHKRASAAEQAICRRWLAAEMLQLQPVAVIALGAMAAQTLFGRDFRLTSELGVWRQLPRFVGLGTWHPSAILRARSSALREEMFQQLVQHLQSARLQLEQKA
ncbi:UdgX family uracil-DNA binding protein [Dyella acidiphila]|uniref:Type-4 uracil-DNA glycosylase n=1 Tax=Dyella acidiphila TaxID=2775866 RepID=A0ABR9GCX6_9GAMM|nr:UdgX family uracil-DNA binding protein [Dyella acidiphila]MBE1161844.1 UdgX family uracil-DNA binding protein [Dyella acidiphila]